MGFRQPEDRALALLDPELGERGPLHGPPTHKPVSGA
jgi:hypothetical protein